MKKYGRLLSLILMCSTLFMTNTLSVMGAENQELGSWETKEDMPGQGRYGLGVAEVNNRIYAIGGHGEGFENFNYVHEYDPQTNNWSIKTPMITPRVGLATIGVNGKIYAIGGNAKLYSNTVEEYDVELNKWSSKASMPTARTELAVAEVNGKIYAIGGNGGNYNVLNTVEEYDPQTDKWTTKANMLTARKQLSAVAVNGKIYAIGGHSYDRNKDIVRYSTVEEYDPQTDKWTTKSSMLIAREGLEVVEVNGKIYAIGGTLSGNHPTDRVEEYDPQTDKWTIMNPMIQPRTDFGAIEANGKIYAIGGYFDGPPYLNTVEEFTPFNSSKDETLELKSIDKMRIGEEVTVDAILHNVDEIYAEDFTVTYDQDIFEYIGYEEIEGLKVVKPLNTEGILRFIIASKGKDKSVDGSEIITKLNFRAKQAGVSKIDATKARIANIETEWDLEEDNCGETTITVEGFLDVNRTNEFTLVDLAIDGYYFSMLADNTDKEKYDADVVIDGTINDEDLVAIVNEMLNNSNYEPNNK